MSQEQFIKILSDMTSIDNQVRRDAEAIFNDTKKNQPNEIIRALLQIGRTYSDKVLRNFCVLILRQTLSSRDEHAQFLLLSNETQDIIKSELLIGVETETEALVRKALCDVVADVFSALITEKKVIWNDVVTWAFNKAKNSDDEMKYYIFRIIRQIAGYFIDIPEISKNFKLVIDLLLGGFQCSIIKTQVETLNTALTFIQYFVDQKVALNDLVGPMLQIIVNCINAKDDIMAQTSIKIFIEIAQTNSAFLIPNIGKITEAMIQLGRSDGLSEDVNRLAGEFLVTLAEHKPKMCMKSQDYINSCIQIFLKMMLNIPDTPLEDWSTILDDKQTEIYNHVVAEEYLDRLSLALDGEHVLPLVWKYIVEFVDNNDWKFRHAALKALSMIAEGCAELLTQNLDEIMNILVRRFQDSDPRVRFATINATGQLSTDLGPEFQTHCHSQIIPKFLDLMNDNTHPKLQAFTAAAIINFCEKFNSDLLQPYLQQILPSLIKLVSINHRRVQEQAITAIASIASCTRTLFTPYYDTFIPYLISFFKQAEGVEYRALRGKAIECISIIAVAVGKDKFSTHAIEVLEMLRVAQLTVKDDDDPQKDYFRQAWARLSTCIGVDFIPYLQYVVEPLFNDIQQNVDVKLLEDEEEEQAGWQYLLLGDDSKIGIHTSALDDKINACNLIHCYVAELKEGFFPYVEKSTNILVPLVSYPYNEAVKVVALKALPHLLNSTKLYLTKEKKDFGLLNQLFGFMYPRIFEAISEQADTEVMENALETLHKCIYVMGNNFLSEDKLIDCINKIKDVSLWLRKRRETLTSTNTNNDEDDSVFIKDEIKKESNIINELIELMGTLLKTHTLTMLGLINRLKFLDFMLELIQENRTKFEKQLAICIFDDIVEFSKENSHPLMEVFVPYLIKYAKDPNPSVRQACTYGFGVVCENGGNAIHPFMQQIFNLIIEIITAQDARSKKYIYSTENAVSSLGKILQFQPQFLGTKIGDVFNQWIDWLPIETDVIEAKSVNERLCNFIQGNNPNVFGENFKNLPKIFAVFAQTVNTKFAKKETSELMISILKQMKSTQVDLFQKSFNTLKSNHQEKLAKLLQ